MPDNSTMEPLAVHTGSISSLSKPKGGGRPTWLKPVVGIVLAAIAISAVIVVVLWPRGGQNNFFLTPKCDDAQKTLGCTKCDKDKHCTECETGMAIATLANGMKVCGVPCEEAQTATNNKCTRCANATFCTDCAEGYVLEQPPKNKGLAGMGAVCQWQCNAKQKAAGCKRCNTDTECVTCEEEYKLDNLDAGVTCSYVCRPNQHDMGCKQCSSARKCTECNSTLYKLEEGDGDSMDCKFQCTVPGTENVIADKGVPQGACIKCLPPDSTKCAQCIEGYELRDNDGNVGVVTVGTCHPVGFSGKKTKPSTFWMYRAKNSANYPFDSINLASAGGLLSYLAIEVIDHCEKGERHYGIDRIQRYKVTMWNPPQVALGPHGNVHQRARQFMQFKNIDKAMCTAGDRIPHQFDANGVEIPCDINGPEECYPVDCMADFKKYGYAVGCQPRGTEPPEKHYPKSYWYSLPGACPSKTFDKPTPQARKECKEKEPGGRCDKPDGTPFCTYSIEEDSWISLDYLRDACDTPHCIATEGCPKEAGIGFWEEMPEYEKNKGRTDTLIEKFGGEHLDEPPACDGW